MTVALPSPYWGHLSPAQQAGLEELARSGSRVARQFLKQLAEPPLSLLPARAQAELAVLAFAHAGEAEAVLGTAAGRGFSGQTAAQALLLFARTPPAERALIRDLLRRETTTPEVVRSLLMRPSHL